MHGLLLSFQGQQVLPSRGTRQISSVNIGSLIVLIGSVLFVLSSASAQPFSNVFGRPPGSGRGSNRQRRLLEEEEDWGGAEIFLL